MIFDYTTHEHEMLVIDTYYRHTGTSSNFKLALHSNTLRKAEQVRMIKCNIPNVFYNIASKYSNNTIVFNTNDPADVPGRITLTIPDNYYTYASLKTYLEAAFLTNGVTLTMSIVEGGKHLFATDVDIQFESTTTCRSPLGLSSDFTWTNFADDIQSNIFFDLLTVKYLLIDCNQFDKMKFNDRSQNDFFQKIEIVVGFGTTIYFTNFLQNFVNMNTETVNELTIRLLDNYLNEVDLQGLD